MRDTVRPRITVRRLTAADATSAFLAIADRELNDDSAPGAHDSCFGSESCAYRLGRVRLGNQVRQGCVVLVARSAWAPFCGCVCLMPASEAALHRFRHYAPTTPDALYLHTLCVGRQVRRHGVGARLLRAAVARASEVYLTVRPDAPGPRGPCQNELTRRYPGLLLFYHRHGFRIVDRLSDRILMCHTKTQMKPTSDTWAELWGRGYRDAGRRRPVSHTSRGE